MRDFEHLCGCCEEGLVTTETYVDNEEIIYVAVCDTCGAADEYSRGDLVICQSGRKQI